MIVSLVNLVSLPVLYYTVDDRHILDILCIVLVVLVPVFVAKDFVRGRGGSSRRYARQNVRARRNS